MFAVVEIAGFQYRVKQDTLLTVPRLQAAPGEEVSFKVLVGGASEAEAQIGMPYINGSVKATILDHAKADKVIIFHKKRRKGYRKRNGHRQPITRIKITSIAL
jgi:large subunit ribosomal protein L21